MRLFGKTALCRSGDGVTHAVNINGSGYEFESGKTAIS
jgi:hypothetical protein